MADQQTPSQAIPIRVTQVGPSGQVLGDPFDDPFVAWRVNTIAPYSIRFDYDGASPPNLVYYGLAAIGSATSGTVWQIRKYAYSGSNMISQLWADGDNYFNNIWDNRASLTYA